MLCSFSALDAYFGIRGSELRFEYYSGDLIALAKNYSDIQFAGLPYADAVCPKNDTRYRCSLSDIPNAYPQTKLVLRDTPACFDARDGVYDTLRNIRPVPAAAPAELVLFEAAVLSARYAYEPHVPADCDAARIKGAMSEEAFRIYQRDMLDLIVSAPHAAKGFRLLHACGFMETYWPELAALSDIDQSKDYHPEGDAWAHTLETFSYRKNPDKLLSMGLLLHDTGKADAVSLGGRRFDKHSELGEQSARSFLKRLGYQHDFIRDVAFLVRYHMLPAALPRLPASEPAHVLRHPLFPVLLELYRCDEMSSFKGPERYYEACAVYKTFLRRSKTSLHTPAAQRV